MKPVGLAQCLPVVSATGIQGNEAQRPEGPTQLFSWPPGSDQTPNTVSALWALSVAWNPSPVADTTGRHSIGLPGLRHNAQPAKYDPSIPLHSAITLPSSLVTPVRLTRPSRPPTNRTLASEANTRKQRSDEIQRARFGRTNRSRDVKRWTILRTLQKREPRNTPNTRKWKLALSSGVG
ncbi:hypothetical protein TBK1r_68850 [Stieleria magnilauensis]|uniref:Uncharacterized protein n=1 Tax=Stieleria magnilauensis TaxID=2527963 RepID=A0ABX5Y0R7_9BACT|nr:hypothetical protein TBK1r_68850 [Planctomycetes bacterium TBK1r]